MDNQFSFVKPKRELPRDQPEDPDEVLWRMLMVQSVAIQPFISSMDHFIPNH